MVIGTITNMNFLNNNYVLTVFNAKKFKKKGRYKYEPDNVPYFINDSSQT